MDSTFSSMGHVAMKQCVWRLPYSIPSVQTFLISTFWYLYLHFDIKNVDNIYIIKHQNVDIIYIVSTFLIWSQFCLKFIRKNIVDIIRILLNVFNKNSTYSTSKTVSFAWSLLFEFGLEYEQSTISVFGMTPPYFGKSEAV